MHTIAIDNLSKSFRVSRNKTIRAVSGLNLTVDQGEVLGFLGPNGAGKTTTIKMICGLVAPDQGSVKVLDIDVQRHLRKAVHLMGAVLEGTRNIYWRLTPLQNLAYSARIKGIKASSVRDWGQTLLEDLDLWERRNDPVRMFSRGMQQKTAIACALIHKPTLVLLDEPTLGLDVEAAVTVKEWIQTLANRFGMTLVLTTHQLSLAEELCQRVVIIKDGVKITDQAVSDLRRLHQQAIYQVKVEGDAQEVGKRASRALARSQRGASGRWVSIEHSSHEIDLNGGNRDCNPRLAGRGSIHLPSDPVVRGHFHPGNQSQFDTCMK